ncbi:hypothetical protein ABL78_3955 [Leptomonas seymouri]|uniref:Mnd1 HTH domain-containing protein n=1 Tax=Leptomonas seymouri TaxID=5684 RepID=A0A0N1PBI5_LEPSE|nr:hypothetical protein ABL78_3955 [Leptomonas seymouri]|eukprot:KPI86964.1 hypothetical protein ABL78_3955 [Leptomonas seymouri]
MCAAAAKRKKGLSLEEKVVLVECWITAHPQPYTMKELQQLISKQTPVIYQSVEECVQLLVSENRVQQDRVGVSTLFWKFPLTETQKLNHVADKHRGNGAGGGSGGPLTYAELLRRLTCGDASLSSDSVERLCASVASGELREWHIALQLEHAKVDGLLEGEHRRVGFTEEEPLRAELAQLRDLTMQRARLLAQQKALSSLQSLPELLRRLADATTVATEAANRWTDNYYLAEMEVVVKAGQSKRDVRAALGVPPIVDFLSDDDGNREQEEEEAAAEIMAGVKSSTSLLKREDHAEEHPSFDQSATAIPSEPSPAPAEVEPKFQKAAPALTVEAANAKWHDTPAADVNVGVNDLPARGVDENPVEQADDPLAAAKVQPSIPAPKRRRTRTRTR